MASTKSSEWRARPGRALRPRATGSSRPRPPRGRRSASLHRGNPRGGWLDSLARAGSVRRAGYRRRRGELHGTLGDRSGRLPRRSRSKLAALRGARRAAASRDACPQRGRRGAAAARARPPPRPTWPTLAALAIVTGLVALGLGAWAVVEQTPLRTTSPGTGLSRSTDRSPSSPTRPPSGTRCAARSTGSCSSSPATAAPSSRSTASARRPTAATYAAWLVPPGSATPVAVAEFDGTAPAVPLSSERSGARASGVTLEPIPGTDARRGGCGSSRSAPAHRAGPVGVRPEPDTRHSAASSR